MAKVVTIEAQQGSRRPVHGVAMFQEEFARKAGCKLCQPVRTGRGLTVSGKEILHFLHLRTLECMKCYQLVNYVQPARSF